MDGWLRDLRAAARTLRRHSGFTCVAVATLALGLGANTLILSVMNAVVFAPLPYAESERLVVLWEQAPIPGYEELPLSVPDYLDLRRERTVFDALAVFEYVDVTLTGSGRPRELKTVAASPDLFPVLRAKAELGRAFVPADAEPGGDLVAVLSHAFWRRELGSDPAIVGRRLVLNERPYTVVGVMPAAFQFPFALTWQGRTYQRPPTDVFLPRTLSLHEHRGDHSLMAVGRLAPGVSVDEANLRLAPMMARLAAAHSDVHPPGFTARVVPASRQASAAARPALFVLWTSVVLLLLIACANVANLLLARATGRAKEISLRAAFGASRRRLVRQLMSESVLLGIASGTIGTFLAAWGIQALSRLVIDELPRLSEARLDAVALGWSALLALGTALLFGLAPALYAARPDLVRALKAEGRGLSIGPARGRLLQGVVVFELALAVALLTAAGWMFRSWQELGAADPGFDVDGVTAIELPLNSEPYDEDAWCRYTVREIIASASDLPGVEAAGVGSYVPLAGQEDAGRFTAEGGVPPEPGEVRLATRRRVTPGFLPALGIRVVAGRPLRSSDDPTADRVVLVNRTLAQRAWPGIEPVGRRLTVDDPSAPEARWWRVVGVVADVRDRGLHHLAEPTIYFPLAQSMVRRLTLVVRSSEDLMGLAPVIEEAVWSVDSGLPVRLRSLQSVIRDVLARFELNALLLALFAGAALLLAGSGIYGVLSFLVEQRRHELAIRLAVGARREQLAALVVRQGVALAALGAGLGLVIALGLGRALRSAVYGMSPLDPTVLIGVPALLFAVTVASTLYPARRATRVDAVGSLRAE